MKPRPPPPYFFRGEGEQGINSGVPRSTRVICGLAQFSFSNLGIIILDAISII